MKNIDYFKLQAKNLHKDFNSPTPKYFPDVKEWADEYVVATDDFTLMKAQHLVAKIAKFNNWAELAKSSEEELEIAKWRFDHRDIADTAYEEIIFDSAEDKLKYLAGEDNSTDINEIVECLHCGKRFPFSEVKVIKLKPKFIEDPNDPLCVMERIVCKNYPKCNGEEHDLMPAQGLDDWDKEHKTSDKKPTSPAPKREKKIHAIELPEKALNKIKSGRKTMYLRVVDYAKNPDAEIENGDIFEFWSGNRENKIKALPLRFYGADSFETLAYTIPNPEATGFDGADDLIETMSKLYSIEDQEENGVIAEEFRVLR